MTSGVGASRLACLSRGAVDDRAGRQHSPGAALRQKRRGGSDPLLVADERQRGPGRRAVLRRPHLRGRRERDDHRRAGSIAARSGGDAAAAVRGASAASAARSPAATRAGSSSTSTPAADQRRACSGRTRSIPSVQINYHIESSVARGESVRGRDRTYLLPSESVRVLSLVPADATDIRDAPSWTFGDIEAQRFRARVFSVVAGVLFAAAALVVIVALCGSCAAYRQRRRSAARRLLSDGAILAASAASSRPCGARARASGWTRELAGRALAALRIAGTSRSAARSSQSRPRGRRAGYEGQLIDARRIAARQEGAGVGVGHGRSDRPELATRAGSERPPPGARRAADARSRASRRRCSAATRSSTTRRSASRWATRPRRAAAEGREPLAGEEVKA